MHSHCHAKPDSTDTFGLPLIKGDFLPWGVMTCNTVQLSNMVNYKKRNSTNFRNSTTVQQYRTEKKDKNNSVSSISGKEGE